MPMALRYIRQTTTSVGLSAPPSGAGHSGTLTDYTGGLSIGTAGTIIENQRIDLGFAHFYVHANNCQFRNCHMFNTGFWGIDAETASGLVVDHCTIDGIGDGHTQACVLTGQNWTVTNCNLFGASNSIFLNGGTGLAEGNWMHDLSSSLTDPHYDCVQFPGGQDGVTIRGNWMAAIDTSNIIIKTDGGSIANVLVEGNSLVNQNPSLPGTLGKPAYPIYTVQLLGFTLSNIVIQNNRIQKGANGTTATDISNYLSNTDFMPTWTGNVDFDSGAAI